MTCGEGLAGHSALPARLSSFLAGMAENLELHLTALDPRDEIAKLEYDAYVDLARQHRDLATRLRATADQMAGYRNLPRAEHDSAAMASPELMHAFSRLVTREEELLAELQEQVERHRAMIRQFSGAGSTGLGEP